MPTVATASVERPGLAAAIDWDRVAAAALTLDEVMRARDADPEALVGEPERVDARWQHWASRAGGPRPHLLAQRLAWQGWDELRARAALAGLTHAPSTADTSWLEDARALSEQAALAGSDAHGIGDWGTAVDGERPFGHLVNPLAFCLDAALPSSSPYHSWGPPAQARARRHLRDRLLFALEPTLTELFHTQRAESALFPLGPTTPTRQYEAFILGHLGDGLATLFTSYPALARLLAVILRQTATAIDEIAQLAAEDADALAHLLGHPQPPGSVLDIRLGVGDTHYDGRSVAKVEWSSGLTAYFKPRDMGVEEAWSAFCAWMSAHGGPDLVAHRVLVRDGYGWAEAVPALETDSDGVRRFYRRAGAMLAVLNALGATDCHSDNVIASGDMPVLIDCETVLTPSVDSEDLTAHDTSSLARAFAAARRWVTDTAFLPSAYFDPSGALVESGTLVYESDRVERVPGWVDVNTDFMRKEMIERSVPSPRSAPRVDGTPRTVAAHEDVVAAGFRDAYEWLMRSRAALTDPDGPLSPFRGAVVRCILRATSTYAYLTRKSLAPSALANGIDRSLEFEPLWQGLLVDGTPPVSAAIVEHERRSLSRLDVPEFDVRAEDLVPRSVWGTVGAPIVTSSAWRRMLDRIDFLSERDLQDQLAILHASFRAREATTAAHSVHPDELREASALVSHATLIATADRLARALVDSAHVGSDGSRTWSGLVFNRERRSWGSALVDDALYDGSAGIGLALAALFAATGNDEWAAASRSALAPIMWHARTPSLQGVVVARGIGVGFGASSMAFGLASAGAMLGDDELIAGSADVASLISEAMIDRDAELDLLGGSAGAIIGLLAVHEAAPADLWLDRASHAGEHLLAHATIDDRGMRWKAGGRALCGAAHGNAGFALALGRLAVATGDERFARACEEAIRWESEHFVADLGEAGNWPDRRSDPPGDMRSWCHGAPGIALSRAGLPPEMRGETALLDLRRAVTSSRGRGLRGALDQMCCGMAGRMDVELTAAPLVGDTDGPARALRLASAMIEAADAAGGFRLVGSLPVHAPLPGLFQGNAAIVHALARLARPDAVPSVLAWQSRATGA